MEKQLESIMVSGQVIGQLYWGGLATRYFTYTCKSIDGGFPALLEAIIQRESKSDFDGGCLIENAWLDVCWTNARHDEIRHSEPLQPSKATSKYFYSDES